MKKELENDFADLIRKYKEKLPAGEIAESLIGFVTCVSCAAAYRAGELDTIEDDLCNIIKNNVEKSKIYFDKFK